MTRLLALALLLCSCASVQAQRDGALVMGGTAVIVGTVAAADPTGAVEDRGDRHLRTGIVLGAAVVTAGALVVLHELAADATLPARTGDASVE